MLLCGFLDGKILLTLRTSLFVSAREEDVISLFLFNDDEDFVHIGTVEVSSGKAEVVNGKLVEGEIIIDLTTLRKGNPRLDNHLKDDDFFNVAIFPNATFRLKNYSNGLVNGELSVLGIQKAISFPLTISMNENSLNING